MIRKRLFALLLIVICLPFLGGWFYPDSIEVTMKEFGFKLKKKQDIIIPYTDQKETRYIFTHKSQPVVIINEYPNGFIEIQANYSSTSKDETRWNLRVKRTVERGAFRDTIYRIFILGDNK
jgi:hypothetical protein